MTALVIDDSRAMRAILSQILKKLGFEVVEAGDGRAGLERLRDLPATPEVALVDWNMPGVDGFAFLKTVRAHPAWEGMRIVMVTTETEMDQMAAALAAGANEYVLKPFTREAIQQKLALVGLNAVA